jgi:hypothetical protein
MNGIEHIEIPSKNLEESMVFYSRAFGWECRKHNDYYAYFKAPNGVDGGFDPSGAPSADSGTTIYIRVDDIASTLSKIEELGGTVLRSKTEIGGEMGFYALFTDPHGNRIGLWSAD